MAIGSVRTADQFHTLKMKINRSLRNLFISGRLEVTSKWKNEKKISDAIYARVASEKDAKVTRIKSNEFVVSGPPLFIYSTKYLLKLYPFYIKYEYN